MERGYRSFRDRGRELQFLLKPSCCVHVLPGRVLVLVLVLLMWWDWWEALAPLGSVGGTLDTEELSRRSDRLWSCRSC